MPSNTEPRNLLAQKIIQHYGLTPVRTLPAAKGYRNTSVPVLTKEQGLVNVMLYKDEAGITNMIKRADMVANFVAERGLPARHSLSDNLIQIHHPAGTRYAGIYNYLPGTTIPWEAYTRGHIVALGATLAKLHQLLYEYPEANTLPSAELRYDATNQRMQDYFALKGVASALRSKLGLAINPAQYNLYHTLFTQLATHPARQALHLDFVRGNILFGQHSPGSLPTMTGILDFEKVAVGHPLLDVARTLAFLLVDCKYKESSQITDYFLQSGYIKRGQSHLPKVSVTLPSGKRDLLALLLDFFLLHDLYKFLRHNPYESLTNNEHYVRTRAILLARELIVESS